MNARKIILVLGGIAAVAVAALVAFSLFAIASLVGEKNRAKTAKARENRWKREQETQASNLTVTDDGIIEQPKPEDNGNDQGESDDEKKD